MRAGEPGCLDSVPAPPPVSCGVARIVPVKLLANALGNCSDSANHKSPAREGIGHARSGGTKGSPAPVSAGSAVPIIPPCVASRRGSRDPSLDARGTSFVTAGLEAGAHSRDQPTSPSPRGRPSRRRGTTCTTRASRCPRNSPPSSCERRRSSNPAAWNRAAKRTPRRCRGRSERDEPTPSGARLDAGTGSPARTSTRPSTRPPPPHSPSGTPKATGRHLRRPRGTKRHPGRLTTRLGGPDRQRRKPRSLPRAEARARSTRWGGSRAPCWTARWTSSSDGAGSTRWRRSSRIPRRW